jgi:hypothetical protein
MKPCGFNETCKDGVVPYEDAKIYTFKKSVTDVDAGKLKKITYTRN